MTSEPIYDPDEVALIGDLVDAIRREQGRRPTLRRSGSTPASRRSPSGAGRGRFGSAMLSSGSATTMCSTSASRGGATSKPARWLTHKTTIGRVAIEFPVQRLQIGDVVALPEEGSEVEATVAREIDRTELTVRVTLRVEGREDFIKEWPIGEMVTVVRGP